MWNKEKHKAKMKPYADKLISYLKSKGIAFAPDDGKLDNVILTSKDKTVKISHHSFYRYSGIACTYKEGKEKNTLEAVEVTDDMYMNSFMKKIIEMRFKS